MKRSLLVLLVVLMLAGPAGYVALVRAQASRLSTAHEAGARALGAVVLTHAARQPIHDNGAACLVGLARVLPPGHAPFGDGRAESARPLLALLDEQQGRFDALPPAVLETYTQLQPWAASVRECASSAKLQLVTGVRPEDWDATTARAVTGALDTFFALQATELQRMSEDAAPADVRLERCEAALALAADASFFSGSRGAAAGAGGALRLVPRCGEALAAATPAQRKAVAETWGKLTARLVPPSQLVRWERYGEPSEAFARPPPGAPEPFLARLERERRWLRWDALVQAVEAAADGEAGARAAAVAALAAQPDPETTSVAARLDQGFQALEQVRSWLEALAAVAREDEAPRPFVTRENGELRVAAPGAPVVKWRLPGGSAP